MHAISFLNLSQASPCFGRLSQQEGPNSQYYALLSQKPQKLTQKLLDCRTSWAQQLLWFEVAFYALWLFGFQAFVLLFQVSLSSSSAQF